MKTLGQPNRNSKAKVACKTGVLHGTVVARSWAHTGTHKQTVPRKIMALFEIWDSSIRGTSCHCLQTTLHVSKQVFPQRDNWLTSTHSCHCETKATTKKEVNRRLSGPMKSEKHVQVRGVKYTSTLRKAAWSIHHSESHLTQELKKKSSQKHLQIVSNNVYACFGVCLS